MLWEDGQQELHPEQTHRSTYRGCAHLNINVKYVLCFMVDLEGPLVSVQFSTVSRTSNQVVAESSETGYGFQT